MIKKYAPVLLALSLASSTIFAEDLQPNITIDDKETCVIIKVLNYPASFNEEAQGQGNNETHDWKIDFPGGYVRVSKMKNNQLKAHLSFSNKSLVSTGIKCSTELIILQNPSLKFNGKDLTITFKKK